MTSNSPAILVVDSDLRVVQASASSAALLGYDDVQNLIGMDGRQLVVPHEHDRTRQDIEAYLTSPPPGGAGRWHLRRSDGSAFEAQLEVMHLGSGDGCVDRYVVSILDAARQSELRALIDAMHDFQAADDFEGSAYALLARCMEATQATAGALFLWNVGPNVDPVLVVLSDKHKGTIEPESIATPGDLLDHVLAVDRPVFHNDFPASPWAEMLPAGHAPVDNVLFTPLPTGDTVSGLLGVVNKPDGFNADDARLLEGFASLLGLAWSNRRVAEAMRVSEERYRTIFETAATPIARLNRDGIVLDSNSQAERVLGYELEELRGLAATQFIHPDDHERLAVDLADIGELGVYYRRRYRALHRTGRVIEIEVDAATLCRQGDEYEIICQVADVSARNRRERLDKLAIRLLRISHEQSDMRGLARAFCEEVRDSMGCAAVAVRRLRNDGSAPHLANLGFPLAYVEREGELTSDKGCGCAMVLGGCTDPDDPAFSRGGSYTYSEDGEFPDEATESWYRRCRASCIQTGFATMATVPIRIGNRILGLVQAASHEVAGIPHDSLAVLEDSALQLGVAMQRIKAEKQLQAQVRFQQEVLDAIPIPVYYKDVSGRMLGWNRAWLRSTGWKPGEVRGRTAGEVLPPSLAAKFDQMDRDLLGNPGRQVFDHRFQDASGQVRETVIHRATFSGSNEDTGGIIGAIVDVTALKQATTALQEMNTNLEGKVQERLQELQTLYRLSRELVHAHSLHELARTVLHYLHGPLPAELSALAIGVGDRCLLFHRCDRPLADPVVHTVNQRLSRELERLGVPKCPAIEHWAEPTIPAPRDAPPLAQLGSNYLVPLQSEGRSRYLGVLLVACESDQSLTENHVRLLHVAAAQAADAAFRLLSKPRATELAMAVPSTDEDPLETPLHDARPLLDRIHWLAILLDAQHRILYVNDPAMALMDTQREAMVGVPIHRCPSSWDWARLEEAMLPAALVTGSSRVPDLRYTTSDGRTGVLDVRIVSLAKDATPGPLVLLAEDVTQRRDLEARLVMARKMESVGQLAAGIAHEINTPTQYVGDNLQFLGEAFQDMADLFGSIEALLDDPGDDVLPPAHRQRLELARESADLEYLREEIPLAVTQAHEGIERISAIVRSMRDFSHKGSQEKRVADLNRCIQGTVTVARSEWKYVARVVQDLDTDLPSVPTLAAELNQVLLNLLINSAQAIAETERGESSGLGTITIRSERRAGEIELSVTDDGCGIPFELQRRVFVPFFTTKRAGRGTGQGLAISRSIVVDKLGGRLDFESTPGIGTTFTIHLPIET